MTTKKKFYYFKRGETTTQISLAVYQLKNNSLKLIGTCRMQKRANKGKASEVYQYLYNQKLVPVREYKANRGYYFSSNKNKRVQIDQI